MDANELCLWVSLKNICLKLRLHDTGLSELLIKVITDLANLALFGQQIRDLAS